MARPHCNDELMRRAGMEDIEYCQNKKTDTGSNRNIGLLRLSDRTSGEEDVQGRLATNIPGIFTRDASHLEFTKFSSQSGYSDRSRRKSLDRRPMPQQEWEGLSLKSK